MTEPAGVTRVRSFLDAFSRHDEQAMRDYFTDDLAWHVAGSHGMSGDHRGLDDLMAYFGQLRSRSDGSFALAPESVLASDHHAAFFTRATGHREDRVLDVVLAHAVIVRSDGLWREYWVCANDQDAEDSFWS
jgi:ketosteroid isomerase-like protein